MAFAELSKRFEYHGYPCVILWHPREELPLFDPFLNTYINLSYYCGYVGLPEGSKYYGIDYDDIPVYCHGGLTYGRFHEQDKDWWATDEFMEDGFYWIGFDCNHLDDTPINCDMQFVENELKNIVDQLIEIKDNGVNDEF